MKLHTVFITYNRLELTKQAIESYLQTVTGEHSLVVVDNASTDGTRQWLLDDFDYEIHLLTDNRYPGYATNFGWQRASKDATHLHRADNDFAFLPGWCEEVERMFSEVQKLGQLGMRTDEEELHNGHNVGGNCVIDRRLWDKGLRWDETPWPDIPQRGYTEDSYFSPNVAAMGWKWDRVERPCIQSLAYEDPSDPYYQKSWEDRGIIPSSQS